MAVPKLVMNVSNFTTTMCLLYVLRFLQCLLLTSQSSFGLLYSVVIQSSDVSEECWNT